MKCERCSSIDIVFSYGNHVEFYYCIKCLECGLATWESHIRHGSDKKGWTVRTIPSSETVMAALL